MCSMISTEFHSLGVIVRRAFLLASLLRGLQAILCWDCGLPGRDNVSPCQWRYDIWMDMLPPFQEYGIRLQVCEE